MTFSNWLKMLKWTAKYEVEFNSQSKCNLKIKKKLAVLGSQIIVVSLIGRVQHIKWSSLVEKNYSDHITENPRCKLLDLPIKPTKIHVILYGEGERVRDPARKKGMSLSSIKDAHNNRDLKRKKIWRANKLQLKAQGPNKECKLAGEEQKTQGCRRRDLTLRKCNWSPIDRQNVWRKGPKPIELLETRIQTSISQ